MTHTNKKWRHDEPSQSRLNGQKISACDIANDNGEFVATVYGRTAAICKSNVKLIAAAPDLLEALIVLNNEVVKSCNIGNDPLLMNLFKASQDAIQATKKASAQC